MKYVSVRGHPRPGEVIILFEITRTFVLFSFPKILDTNYHFTKARIFLISIYITFLKLKIIGSFSTKNSLTWRVKCERSNLRKP